MQRQITPVRLGTTSFALQCALRVGRVAGLHRAEMRDDNTARTLETPPEVERRSVQPGPMLTPMPQSQIQSPELPNVGTAQKEDNHMDDFAAALESYTLETEPAPSEDNVFKGTVVKITPTHVVVDIGFKSEGLVPIAEVTDPQGNIKFEPGQEIEVMVQRGENEEGSVLLSNEHAARVRI